jgi:osmotically-inducible protein OsmY
MRTNFVAAVFFAVAMAAHGVDGVPDDELARSVEERLQDNQTIMFPDRIQVEADEGTVILRGHVQSIGEAAAVQDIAFQTPGVRRVDNRLGWSELNTTTATAH